MEHKWSTISQALYGLGVPLIALRSATPPRKEITVMRLWIQAPIALLLVMGCAGSAFCQRSQRGFRGGSRVADGLPQGNSEAEKKILAQINQIQAAGEVHLNVEPTDGRWLRLLTESAGAKNVVELGTSTGASGLWLCMALQKTGGKLTTFEYDSNRAAIARRNFQQAGIDQIVTIVQGDAHQNISRLKEPIDVLFIDADKDYADYLNRLLPLVRPGGLILAHNEDSAPEYMRLVTSNPALETLSYREGGGLAVTLKKR